MKDRIYFTLISLLLTIPLISCDREPVAPPEPKVDYITIAQLKAMYNSQADTIKSNLYIQGVITLTPEYKNLPVKIAYIQDSTDAVCLVVTDATNTLTMDSEVKVLCYGGILDKYNGLLQFGNISISKQVQVVNLVAETPKPDTLTIAQLLTGNYQSRYVYIPGAQFAAAGTFSGSQVLTDCTSEIDVYTRSDATFASNALPTGNGSLKGIASVYNDQQILLRDPSELDMKGTRCGLGGKTYLTEDYTGLAGGSNVNTLPGWLTYSEAGTKTWFGYVLSSNNLVETTAYKSNMASVITWMITPQIDLTGSINPYISFDCADGFDNGATLQLYVSTDYTGSATPWTSGWTELTFTHPVSNASGYSKFATSGKVDLSAYKGNKIYIAWKYSGADLDGTANDKTTTWEIDNVIVGEK